MATVRDIAGLTGFSIATVSRVLNQDESFSVSDVTKNKILHCAKELNYELKIKSAAPVKKEGSDYRIGIIPIGLESTGRGELQDPYYLYIRNGVEERLNEIGIHDIRVISLYREDDYRKLDELDGMVVIGKRSFDVNNPYFKKIKHIVFVDYDFDYNKYDCVLSDFTEATRVALDYLVSRGYHSIGYFGSCDYVNDFGKNKMIRRVDSRQSTYEQYMKEKNMDWKRYCYVGERFTAAAGYELARKAILSRELAEAFLIGSDPMAMGVYRAFGEHRIEIGKDVGLISIDGIADTKYMNPPLTTVKVNAFNMGRTAVDCLQQQINGREYSVKVILPVELQERKSCK